MNHVFGHLIDAFMQSVQKVKQLVDELYEYRDNYFVINELNSDVIANKEVAVQNKLEEVVAEIDKLRDDCERHDKATFCMLKGRALNVTSKLDTNALDLLSRSVKLNPQLTDAWIQLGECFWKKNDPKAALNCFEGALQRDENNKVALRNASMVLRQIGDNLDEKRQNLLKSLEKAKAAVKADVEDGVSWYILGNAYLTLFFSSTNQDLSVLKQCKAAYTRAKRSPVANTQSDFLLNFSNVCHYEEDFQTTIDLLSKAAVISPDWDEPREKRNLIVKYLRDTFDMIDKKASLKTRRLQNLLNDLVQESAPGKYSMEFVGLKHLTVGQNSNANVICKVIGSINVDKALAHTICVIDHEEECCAVVIFNLAVEIGFKLGDTIVIKSPVLRFIEINSDDIKCKYQSIRINDPLSLIVNGKKLPFEYIARPKIDNCLKND